MRNLRVASDDLRRLKELYYDLAGIIQKWKPHALAYEVYQPFKAQGGNAWKSARAEGMVQAVGLAFDLVLLPFIPVDLKLGIAGNRSASKKVIQDRMCSLVDDFELMLGDFPKTRKEHPADAAGYGLLAFNELQKMRDFLGVKL